MEQQRNLVNYPHCFAESYTFNNESGPYIVLSEFSPIYNLPSDAVLNVIRKEVGNIIN